MPKMICPDCGSDLVFVPEDPEDIAYYECTNMKCKYWKPATEKDDLDAEDLT